MKEKDVHRLIEEQDKEKKALMYEKFKEKHNLASNTRVVKYNKKRICIASVAATAFVAIFLIIAIPLLINNINSSKMRYFDLSDCIAIDLDYTVKDYAESNGLSLLYIDWYDCAEEVRTWLFVNKDNEDEIIYIKEAIANGETGDIVELYILEQNINLDSLALYEEACVQTAIINGISVNWFYRNRISVATFKFNGYKYYIVLDEPMDEESVLQIVEEMLNR